MANSFSLVGQDTVIINDRVLDLATGTVGEVAFETDVANIQVGKDHNAIFAFNAAGLQANVTLRLPRGGEDDKWLNGLFAQQNANFTGTKVLTGAIVKKIGDGKGDTTSDTYNMSGGIFARPVSVQSNVEGDIEQGVAIYNLKFAKVSRNI